MSQENVETVERAIAAINARDIDGYLACCTENVELLQPLVGAEYFGADGIRRFFTDIEDIGPDFRIEVQRVQAIGDSAFALGGLGAQVVEVQSPRERVAMGEAWPSRTRSAVGPATRVRRAFLSAYAIPHAPAARPGCYRLSLWQQARPLLGAASILRRFAQPGR